MCVTSGERLQDENKPLQVFKRGNLGKGSGKGSQVCLQLYLLLAALRVLLPILGFSQQVGEGQRFEGAGAGGPGIPERVVVPRVPPAPDRAQRARAHAARGVDAVDADHLGGLSRDPTDKKSPNFLCFLYRGIREPASTTSTER